MGIMNLSELLDSSVSILRKYSKSFIIFNLGYWSLALIILMIMMIPLSLGFAGVLMTSEGESAGIVIFAVLLVVLTLTLGFCNSVGAIHLAAQEVLAVPQDAAKAIGSALKSTLRVGGLSALGLLPLVPLGYGGWWLLQGSVNDLSGSTSDDMMAALGSADQRVLLTLLGILVVVLIFLALLNAYATLFTYALQAMVLEKKNPVAALRRSVELVRGKFWYLYGVISLIALVMYGISFSLDSFFLVLSGLVELGIYAMGLEPGLGFTVIYVYGRGLASFIYTLLFNSLGAVILTQLYFKRVYETEGYDLTLRVLRLQPVEKIKDGP